MGMKKCCTLQVKQTWFKTGLFMKLSTNNLLLGKAEKSDCSVWGYSVKLGAGVLLGHWNPYSILDYYIISYSSLKPRALTLPKTSYHLCRNFIAIIVQYMLTNQNLTKSLISVLICIVDPWVKTPVLDQNCLISLPHHRLNGLKTILFTVEHTHIAYIWEHYSPQAVMPKGLIMCQRVLFSH